jgi:hypothetical protein
VEDTTEKSRKLVFDIVMSKTVEERFLMCAELYEEAKEFAKIGMPDGLSRLEEEGYVSGVSTVLTRVIWSDIEGTGI